MYIILYNEHGLLCVISSEDRCSKHDFLVAPMFACYRSRQVFTSTMIAIPKTWQNLLVPDRVSIRHKLESLISVDEVMRGDGKMPREMRLLVHKLVNLAKSVL